MKRILVGTLLAILGISATIFASFNLKYDTAWLSVLIAGVILTLKGGVIIDNHL